MSCRRARSDVAVFFAALCLCDDVAWSNRVKADGLYLRTSNVLVRVHSLR